MKRVSSTVTILAMFAVLLLAGCSSYQVKSGSTGEPHPGHVGHERH